MAPAEKRSTPSLFFQLWKSTPMRSSFSAYRAVVAHEELAHVFPGPFRGADHERVQLAVDQDRAGGDLELRIELGGADLQEHVAEVRGFAGAGEVDAGAGVAGIGQALAVERGDDAVDAASVLVVAEAVFFGGDEDHAGAVVELDGGGLRGARADAACADGGFKIAADRVGVGVLDRVGLRDHEGVGVVADDGDLLRAVLHVDVQFRLDAGRGIAAGRIALVALR